MNCSASSIFRLIANRSPVMPLPFPRRQEWQRERRGLFADVLADRVLEMTDAYFLIVAERQARPGAGFEALLLPDEIVGVLLDDRAETRKLGRATCRERVWPYV